MHSKQQAEEKVISLIDFVQANAKKENHNVTDDG
jgi:hypothetical protein